MNPSFWRRRSVFITGHTGFKGAWLTAWLKRSGASVTGYALAPPTRPSLFEEARVGAGMTSIGGDVRDLPALRAAVRASAPDVVIHLAAQPLVRASYDDPVGTYATNVMGTVNLLEAVRSVPDVRVVIVVTSDKCYENRETGQAYAEAEPMGGKDPYSSSKGCAELATSAYRHSFFRGNGAAKVASVRAGNAIGGGDWATDRLVPDLVRAFSAGTVASVRHPDATRPWQFVLDPLAGYLTLAEALWTDDRLAQAWNFGPSDADIHPVRWIADRLAVSWGNGARWREEPAGDRPEAFTLRLDSARARSSLGWSPRLPVETAVDWIAEFHKAWLSGDCPSAALVERQIDRFEAIRR